MAYDLTEKKCPICGKTFIVAPYHAWTDTRRRKKEFFCSYTCFLAWDKKHPRKRTLK